MTVLYPYKDGRGGDVVAVKAACDPEAKSFVIVKADGTEIELCE